MLSWLHGLVSDWVDARPFVVLRTALGIVAMVKVVHLSLRVASLANATPSPWFPAVPDVLTPVTAAGLMVAWFASATALTIGLRPRVAAGTLALLAAALMLADGRMYNQHLYLLGLLCAIVACTPLRGKDPSSSWDVTWVPRWSVTVMMFQASVVYGFGALAKISPDFVTGRVLFTLFAQQPVTGLFGSLATSGALLGLLAAATIVTEAFLAVGLWVRRLRPVVLGIVGPLHLGMLLFLPLRLSDFLGLVAFGAIQLSLVLIMFAPKERVLVVWDDRCSFCSQWVKAIRGLDWLRRIELQPISRPEAYVARGISPDAAPDALQLAPSDGHVHAGFEAVRRIAYRLPLTMLLAPWLALPPVRAAGAAIYTRVARRRRCAVPGGLPA